MRDFAHHFLLGYFLDSDYHLQPRRHYGHRRKTSKDAVLRKDVPFGVAKPQFNIYTPFFPKNRHFGARFRWYLEIFGRKTALALEVLRVKVIVAR